MLGLLSSLYSLNFGYMILSSYLKRALRWLSFRRQLQNCCFWEPRFQEGSCHSPVRGAQTSTLCTNKCALCWTPPFFFRSPGTSRQRPMTVTSPYNTLGPESPVSFSSGQHITYHVAICCWVNGECPLRFFRERTLEGGTWFPLTLPQQAFPFDFH